MAQRRSVRSPRASGRLTTQLVLVVGICVVYGLQRWAFVGNKATKQNCLRRVSLSANPEDKASSVNAIDRRQLLVGAGLTATIVGQSPSYAAFPMMEEYNVGSGSIIAPSEDEVKEIIYNREMAWKTALGSPLGAAAKQFLVGLDEIEDFLRKEDYENARLVLARPYMVILGIKISPQRQKPKSQGAWAAVPAAKLEDLTGSVQQLEEWCFTNRVIYFNSADLAQVAARPETKGAMAKLAKKIEEPLEFLGNVRDAVKLLLKQCTATEGKISCTA